MIPDLHHRPLAPGELETLLTRHRLLVGLLAMHEYVTREPGKLERCARYDFPAFMQTVVPMTTPSLIDDHLRACDERDRHLRRSSA